LTEYLLLAQILSGGPVVGLLVPSDYLSEPEFLELRNALN